jgi:hypothetical protein
LRFDSKGIGPKNDYGNRPRAALADPAATAAALGVNRAKYPLAGRELDFKEVIINLRYAFSLKKYQNARWQTTRSWPEEKFPEQSERQA